MLVVERNRHSDSDTITVPQSQSTSLSVEAKCQRDTKRNNQVRGTKGIHRRLWKITQRKKQRKKPSTTASSREIDRAQRTRSLTQTFALHTQVSFRALRATRHYQTDHMYAARLYENSYRPISRRYSPFSSYLYDCGLTHMGNTCRHSHKPADNTVTATISHTRARHTACTRLYLRGRLDFWPIEERERERIDVAVDSYFLELGWTGYLTRSLFDDGGT